MIRKSTFPGSRYHRRLRLTGTQQILAYIGMVIIGLTILITVIAFIIDPQRLSHRNEQADTPVSYTRPADPVPASLMNQETYTLLGTLRSGTCDNPSIPLIVEPWFYYDATDISFYQELQLKSRRISTVITDFFPRYTIEELRRMGEQNIKKELTDAVNGILVLGSIDRLYFNEFTFFD